MNWRTEIRKEIDPLFEGKEGKLQRTFEEGKYKLEIFQFETKEGCWGYTQGIVYRNNLIITKINRNYSSFPFSWIIGHPNGHDYLIAGEDYQGQTIIQLDTSTRVDILPDDAKKGYGFCWVDHHFYSEQQILIVDGCIWACPYEFRFYDFSDPLNFKELKLADKHMYIEATKKLPTFESDGIIRCYQLDESNEYDDKPDDFIPPVVAYQDYKRVGDELVFQHEWVSEAEQIRRKKSEEARKRHEAEIEKFKTNDPLYVAYTHQVKDPILNPEDHHSYGVTYDGWCPDFKIQERRWCRRIISGKKGYTVDFEWATKTGPIKLVIYKDGKHLEDKFWMEHSVQSIQDAFAYAKRLI